MPPHRSTDIPVITAAELVHGLGLGTAAVLEALDRGCIPFREAADLVAGFRPGTLVAPCPTPDPRIHLRTPKLRKLMSDEALFLAVAARRATEAAGLAPGPARPVADERLGAFVACGMTASAWHELVPAFAESLDEHGVLSLERLGARGLRRLNPLYGFQVLANLGLSFVAIEERARGDNAALAPWEGGGAWAVGAALGSLNRGASDAVLAGGTSAMAGPQGVFWLARHGLLAPPGTGPGGRPADGSGLVPADGAAVLVLERGSDARRRGVRPLAAASGFAQETIPAAPGFAPCRDPAVVARVVRRALADAALEPDRVDAAWLTAAGDATADRAVRDGLAEALGGSRPVRSAARVLGTLFAAAPAATVALAAHVLAGRWSFPPSPPDAAAPPGSGAARREAAAVVCSAGPAGAVSAVVLEEAVP